MADPALPQKIKRELWRGDRRTWTHVFRLGPLDTDPLRDLTGHAFTAQYRADKDRGEVIATAECTVSAEGTVTEVLTSVEADKLPGEEIGLEPPRVYWDLQSVDGDGERRTWLYADVPVKGDRTHG